MEVKDSGSGMTEVVKAEDLESALHHQTHGRGLGLAAVSHHSRSQGIRQRRFQGKAHHFTVLPDGAYCRSETY